MAHIDFCNLHCHSDTSVLDGAARPWELAERAAKLKQPYLAITDHGTLGAVADVYVEAKKQKIQMIAGCEFYIVPDTQAVGFGVKGNLRDDNNYHLTMLAKNEQGYRDLVKLSSKAHERENFYGDPRIDHNMLREVDTENIICLSGCIGGELAQTFLNVVRPLAAKRVKKRNERTKKEYETWEWRHPKSRDKDHPFIEEALDAARDVIKMYRSLFPDDQYIYEIMYHGLAQEAWVIKFLLPEARRYGLKWVVTNDSHHAKASDKLIADLLWAIQTRSDFCGSDDPKILDLCSGSTIHKRLEDVVPTKYLKSGIAQAVEIGNMCAGFKITPLESKKHNIPAAKDIEGNEIADAAKEMHRMGKDRLRRLCERNPDRADEYKERYKKEGKIIRQFGYQAYFVIIAVIIKWAKKQGIEVGVGRGSGAGSLRAYCVGITDIDPVRWNLKFERFLNPAKQSLPDFDTDFQSDRFEEVIEKLSEIYGADNVRRVITYSRMAPRGIMTSLLETMPTGMDFQSVKEITKELPTTINDAEAKLDFMGVWWRDLENPQLRQIAEDLKKKDKRFDLEKISSQLYGLRRGVGTHAAGVIISDKNLPLAEWVPDQLIASTGKTVTQYNMEALDSFGFVKFDILSLATLTLLADVYKMIGGNPFPEFNEYEDEETYKLISRIETDSVFQLTGHAARQVIRQIGGCHQFEDIVAVMALGRPGAIRWSSKYRENKGKKNLKLAHPMLNDLLTASNGIILYQEDVLNIGYEIGMSDIEVDELLGAIKKMNVDKMRAVKPKFVKAARKAKWKEVQIDAVWDQIKDYQGYGFNRSHAVSYADLSFKTAYLKANHPAEFIVAKLRQIDKAKREERGPLVRYAKSRGIRVRPPHVNKSGVFTEVQNGDIRFGLSEIVDVGIPAAQAIVERREGDLFVKSDFIAENRGPRGGIRDPYITGVRSDLEKDKLRLNSKARAAIFAVGGFPGQKNKRERWTNERQFLGCNISEHHNQEALKSIRKVVNKKDNLRKLKDPKPNNEHVKIGGVVTSVSTRPHKAGKWRGHPMAFVSVELEGQDYEMIVFAELYSEYNRKLKPGTLIYCDAKLTYGDQYGRSIIVNRIDIFK